MRTVIVLVVGLSALTGLTGPAAAQCTQDADCAGGLACREGKCVEAAAAPVVEPAPVVAPVPVVEPAPAAAPVVEPVRPAAPGPAVPGAARAPGPSMLPPPERPAMGWPIASSVMAFVFGGAVVGLGVSAGLHSDEKWLGIGLGAGALGTLAIFGPVCSTGQSSARSGTPVWGALGARIPAWILYGVTMIEGVAMIGLGIADVASPPALIYTTAATGGASMILFAVDNLVSMGQAQSWYGEANKFGLRPRLEEEAEGFAFQPMVAPLQDLTGRGASGATLGIAGSF